MTAWALRTICRHPDVSAVYLRRGGAKGEIVPLVSDIDFAVIGGPFSESEERSLRDSYDRLARVTTLLDRTLEIYTEEEMRTVYERNHYLSFRFAEGKATWKMLYSRDGANPVAALPAMDITALYGGLANEIKVWWSLFAWRFFHDRKYNQEAVTRNSFCFKTVSEILKMDLALTSDVLTFDRREALARAMPDLSPSDQGLADRLQRAAKRNFRGDVPAVLEETYSFLLQHLNGLYGRLRTEHSIAQPIRHDDSPSIRVEQRIEPWKNGSFFGPREEAHRNALDNWLEQEWGSDAPSKTKIAPAAYFNLDEFGYFIPIDPAHPPSVQQISALNRYHETLSADLRARFRVYLQTPEAAFQVDTEELQQSWQSILTSANNPEVFEILDGASGERPAWTGPVAHFFEEEKYLFYDLLKKPSIYKLNDRDFLRIFWKTAQLVLLNRTARDGTVIYALTTSAVDQALAAAGVALPLELRPLGPIYEHVVRAGDQEHDSETAIAPLVPRALAWLWEIES